MQLAMMKKCLHVTKSLVNFIKTIHSHRDPSPTHPLISNHLLPLQDDTGHEVRSEEVADWRDSEQDRPAVLPLLPSDERDELPARGLLVLRGDKRPRVLQPRREGGPKRPDGEETKVLRSLHRRLSAAEPDEAGPGAGAGAGRADRGLHQHLRARRSVRVEPGARRDQGVREGRVGGRRCPLGLEPRDPDPQAGPADLAAGRTYATHVPIAAGDPDRRQLRRPGQVQRVVDGHVQDAADPREGAKGRPQPPARRVAGGQDALQARTVSGRGERGAETRQSTQVPVVQADLQPGTGIPSERVQGTASKRRAAALFVRRWLFLHCQASGRK